MEFRDDEEHERVDHAHVMGVDADQVHVKAMRVAEHGDEVREHEDEEEEGRDELNHPERRVFMTEHLVVSLDVTELMVGRREAAKGAEGVDHDAERDEADEDDVQPSLFFSEHEHAAGGVDQVGEEVLADLHGGREGHVAEQEDAEDDARDGLGDVGESRGRRLTLGVLEAGAPDVFSRGRGVGVLDGIRGRHLSFLCELCLVHGIRADA